MAESAGGFVLELQQAKDSTTLFDLLRRVMQDRLDNRNTLMKLGLGKVEEFILNAFYELEKRCQFFDLSVTVHGEPSLYIRFQVTGPDGLEEPMLISVGQYGGLAYAENTELAMFLSFVNHYLVACANSAAVGLRLESAISEV